MAAPTLPLPGPVRRFCYAVARLQPHLRLPWGVVMIDERFPDLWDANNATVLEPSPSITASEIRDALLEPVRQAGAPTEHIEFWETSAASPALRELRVAGQQRTPDVVMTF